ncbi:hypothetical protein LASUN_06430 [Lentilactobacillus sunkii]|jgi:hypothetical protein|uniref:Uncharacterized protein n=1 Tax=Lentilactobacillus sunkii TaxID=481719 RepID=A0A1E7XG83_9LACO|nr:hypothetical protein [Lentilactobacillus sunkii]OFA12091.1 hypothetical protein LASUN_06430 [Lentilactobacillus sunkii]
MSFKKVTLFAVSTGICSIFFISAATNSYAETSTNPRVLRAHNWYSTHTGPFGGEYYYKIHFTKHSVYEYHRKTGSHQWCSQHYSGNEYFIRPANVKGAYTFGSVKKNNPFYAETVRPRYFTLSNHKKYWGLEYFDHSNNHGGLDTKAPYRTWCYFTKMKYVTGDWGAWVEQFVY